MKEVYRRELDVAYEIAQRAGEIMLQYFDSGQDVVIKADGSPVTVADKLINTMVIQELQAHFPDDGVIGEEESTAEYGGGRKWLCDPIDGTIAYTWRVPTSMFSLGLVVDGVPQVGVAYDPYLREMYSAVRGDGAYRNDQKLSVSPEQDIEGNIVAVSSNVKAIAAGRSASTISLAKTEAHLAIFSGAVYKSSRVASGQFVGYVEEGVGPHDMAAIDLIVHEAGGRVTDMQGNELRYDKPFRGAIISNGAVHDELLRTALYEDVKIKENGAVE